MATILNVVATDRILVPGTNLFELFPAYKISPTRTEQTAVKKLGLTKRLICRSEEEARRLTRAIEDYTERYIS